MANSEEQGTRPEFRGQRLREFTVPKVGFLRDDAFGEAVLSEYHDRVRRDFAGHEALKVLKTAGGVVHGSNPFAAVLIDMIVRSEFRVAAPADLQAAHDAEKKSESAPNLRGCYKDTALVLRSVSEPNSYLAEQLNGQIGLKTKLPAVICLTGLELVADKESPLGLSFELTEDALYFSAPLMERESDHFDNSAVERATGLPEELGGSERYFYSTEEGLCRLYVGRGWSLDSIWDELPNSQPDGRIVLVDNAVPPPKMAKYLAYMDAANKFLAG